MKFNKKFMLLGVACTAALGLASCGGEEPVTGTYDLKVWTPEAAIELTTKQINDFVGKNEGLKINLTIEKVGEGDAASSMITDVENGADIFFFAQDQLARLVEAKALAKVGSKVQSWIAENNDEASNQASKFSGDTYCFPLTSDNGYFMYYDKSVISEKNLDSLEDLIKECEDKDRLFSFELENAWYNASFFFAAGATSVWTQGADKNWSAKDDYNSAKGLIALQGMKKLISSKAYNNTSGAPDAFAKTGAQKSAIVVSGPWDAAKTKEVLGDNYAATDLPKFTVDGKSYQLGSFFGCKLLGTKPQTDSKKAAMVQKLAQYLTGEEGQNERFKALNWGPSNKKAQQSAEVKADPALAAMALQASHGETYAQGQYPGAWWDIAKAITAGCKNASDAKGYQEVLNTYQSAIDKVVATKFVPVAERAYSVIGGFATSDWKVDIEMEKTKDAMVWTTKEVITFSAGDELKVRAQQSWDYAYGAGEGNFKVETAGTYKVRFEVKSLNADGEVAEFEITLIS